MVKIIKRTFQIISIVFILWIVGLFAGLPLIPFIETDYLLSGTTESFTNGIKLQETENIFIKLEIPDYFSENNQCFDTWFSAKSGQHTLTVSDFSLTTFTKKGKEIKRKNSYLFWEDGSKDESFKIENFTISKTDTAENDKYVFLRNVFDLDNEKEFTVQVKAVFQIDSVPNRFEKTIPVSKKHRLTWNKFRLH